MHEEIGNIIYRGLENKILSIDDQPKIDLWKKQIYIP
jgi:hypothetical protein